MISLIKKYLLEKFPSSPKTEIFKPKTLTGLKYLTPKMTQVEGQIDAGTDGLYDSNNIPFPDQNTPLGKYYSTITGSSNVTHSCSLK